MLIPLTAVFPLQVKVAMQKTSTVPSFMGLRACLSQLITSGDGDDQLRTRKVLPEVCSLLGTKADQLWDMDGTGVAPSHALASAGPSKQTH